MKSCEKDKLNVITKIVKDICKKEKAKIDESVLPGMIAEFGCDVHQVIRFASRWSNEIRQAIESVLLIENKTLLILKSSFHDPCQSQHYIAAEVSESIFSVNCESDSRITGFLQRVQQERKSRSIVLEIITLKARIFRQP